MAGGFSIHAVDLTRGEPATGLRVDLFDDQDRVLVTGCITASGTPDCADLLLAPKSNGAYTALFHVGAYFRRAGFSLPDIRFLDVVPYRFHSRDPGFHVHLPFKFSPWGFSCFRGN